MKKYAPLALAFFLSSFAFAQNEKPSWVTGINFADIATAMQKNPTPLQVAKVIEGAPEWAKTVEQHGHLTGIVNSADSKTRYRYDLFANGNFLELDVRIDPADATDEIFEVWPDGHWMVLRGGKKLLGGTAPKPQLGSRKNPG